MIWIFKVRKPSNTVEDWSQGTPPFFSFMKIQVFGALSSKIQDTEWPQELQMFRNYSRKIDLILVGKERF